MSHPLRILRYNTGTDKKAFVEFKSEFDAVIFNGTIVAYSGASVADLVSMHARKYIIDPQTHIFQQEISAIMSKKKEKQVIKKSVEKYFNELPSSLVSAYVKGKRPLDVCDIRHNLDDLVKTTSTFQVEYVNSYIKSKDYDKYLRFANVGPKPKFIIAPYFMVKEDYSNNQKIDWLCLNKDALEKTIIVNKKLNIPIAAQLVLDKSVLVSNGFIDHVKRFYSVTGYEYILIWIDNFNSFETKPEYMLAFSKLLEGLDSIEKKPIMVYGGFESIMLCNVQSPFRLYGVAQSVGYGEYRDITPVGGGMPINKYYFYPIHQRLRFDDAAKILSNAGYFNNAKSSAEHAADYYTNICNCKQCYDVIGKNIHNFDRYNDSLPYNVPTKNGIIVKNRPTTDAATIAAMHFLHCKVREWDESEKQTFDSMIRTLKEAYQRYMPEKSSAIQIWCEIYGNKKD